MPDYFAGYPVAGTTRHFCVTYASESDADAAARAAAIVSSCEADLTLLQGWFDCNFDASPYSILVHVNPGTSTGGASTRGYTSSKSSQIWIDGTYLPAAPGANTALLRDELARMLFVAELAEVLMDFAGKGWKRKDSNGEGLSRVAAASLHPAGYYPTGKGPCINTWLLSARSDWINAIDGTDVNSDSYGCAALFLNYLIYQRGFSFEQVVSAGNQFGDWLFTPTLAEIFHRLTGEPASAAFGEFTSLVQAHLPQGSTPPLATDNPFPLREASNRRVGFSFDGVMLPGAVDPAAKSVTLRAGMLCGARPYGYHDVRVPFQVTAPARATGFALPVFAWSINGVSLATHGSSTAVTVPFTVEDKTPERVETPEITTVSLTYKITDASNKSTLVFTNSDFPGNGNLDITVSARESLIGGDPASSYTYSPVLTTLEYDMDSAWKRDVSKCDPGRYVAIDIARDGLSRQLADAHNRPDPPDVLRGIAQAVRAYTEAMDAATGGVSGLETAVASVVAAAAFGRADDMAVRRDSDGGLPTVLRLATGSVDAERVPAAELGTVDVRSADALTT